VDSERMLLRVERGKGGQYCNAMLAPTSRRVDFMDCPPLELEGRLGGAYVGGATRPLQIRDTKPLLLHRNNHMATGCANGPRKSGQMID